MSHAHVATYLNDHLAGSVTALTLLTHLESAHAGTPWQRFFADLHADIAADRQELEALLARLQIAVSRPRQAMAWLAEKFAEVKLRLDDAVAGPLHLLEAVEALAVGIEGKRALWRALATAAECAPELRGIDYERLAQRADEQRQRVEVVRLEAARAALGSSGTEPVVSA